MTEEKKKTTRFLLEGLGVWNIYFVLKFALAHSGYLTLDILWNALLMAALLVPVGAAAARWARTIVAVSAATALAYHESWLPGLDSITSNAGNIAGFSFNYVLEFLWDFVNIHMVGWIALAIILYALLRNYVRVTSLVIGYFILAVASPLLGEFFSTPSPGTVAAGSGAGQKTVAANAGDATVEEWYKAFLEYEKPRKAVFPQGLSEKDTKFDILLLNVCSLSNDDLTTSGLDTHPVLPLFNIKFDHFNSATSYSGPASLRLLNGACGQPSHEDLYGERRPECEVLNRLETLGFKQHLLMDHSGDYDSYLQTLRDKGGLIAPLENNPSWPVRYMGFDDEPISDTLAVLRHWTRLTARDKGARSVSFINLIALHDGNRLPRHGRWEEFKPRAKLLLDDLQTFMKELEKTGRKVMLVLVPEHGAAVRGDKVQSSRLRDIPSLRITEVPVLVKFFGLAGLPPGQLHITGDTSHLALISLIGRALEVDYFSKSGGTVPLDELVRDLPETNPVSENAQAQVLRYRDKEYLRQGTGGWKPYPK